MAMKSAIELHGVKDMELAFGNTLDEFRFPPDSLLSNESIWQ